MAIKINNTEVIGNDKKSDFRMLSLDSYTKEELGANAVTGTAVGDAVWNSTTGELSFWTGSEWTGGGGPGEFTVTYYDETNTLRSTETYLYDGSSNMIIAFQDIGYYEVSAVINSPFTADMFVYGAGGGGGGGVAGAGGGVSGTNVFDANSTFVVTVGEKGLNSNARKSFPDGGISSNGSYQEGGGGGGTKISKTYIDFESLTSPAFYSDWILVGAGGGGGSNYQTSGGPGSAGGQTGQDGGYYYPSDGSPARGKGATQTGGGAAGSGGRVGGGNAGGFARGGNAKGGAGGGGWYGGGGAAGYYAQGGGGSSYNAPQVTTAVYYNGSGTTRHPEVQTQLNYLTTNGITVLQPNAGNQNAPGIAIMTILAR